jgi:ABC-type antimicrobial peptide transport system permease subunit
LFPGQEAIGRRILRDPTNDWYTVIGIAADVKNRGPQLPAEPEYYLLRKAVPDATFRNQEPPTGWRAATVIVRTAIDPALAAHSVRQLLASLDPTIPVETETMRQRFAEITARPRFDAMLLTLFAAVALVLAAVGLFGVMAFLVAQRTREFGVRMALGATPAAVMRSALADALRWTLAGLIIGAAGSLSATRLLSSLLFQVPLSDMRAPMAALILLSAVALAASAGPALRAVRVDPIKALREE